MPKPKGYHVIVEIAGHQFVRSGIDTLEFANEVYNAVCDGDKPPDAAWLIEGVPENPSETLQWFTHQVLKMGQPVN